VIVPPGAIVTVPPAAKASVPVAAAAAAGSASEAIAGSATPAAISFAPLFRGERDAEQRDAVGDRGAAALQTLVDAITACNAAGVSASDDPYGDAVAVWSAIHGLTTLRATRPHFERLQSDELMRSIIRRLARITPAERPIHP
jgi:methylthioribose-1-phosphate isomerase